LYSSSSFYNRAITYLNASIFAARAVSAVANFSSASANDFLLGSTTKSAPYVSLHARTHLARFDAAPETFSIFECSNSGFSQITTNF
jgi:hypothetical protein